MPKKILACLLFGSNTHVLPCISLKFFRVNLIVIVSQLYEARILQVAVSYRNGAFIFKKAAHKGKFRYSAAADKNLSAAARISILVLSFYYLFGYSPSGCAVLLISSAIASLKLFFSILYACSMQ